MPTKLTASGPPAWKSSIGSWLRWMRTELFFALGSMACVMDAVWQRRAAEALARADRWRARASRWRNRI